MTNTSISFIKIGSFLNAPKTQKLISFSNMSFRDMLIETNINLIDTEGLEMGLNVDLEFTNLTFDNINYSKVGNLLVLGHLSSNYCVIKDSSFTNLNSAGILIGTTSSLSKKAKVKFINNRFNSFYSESGSFISVEKEAIVEFENCTFTDLHTLSSGAAITAGASKANVVVSNSKFTNNSAVEGSIFNIQSESMIRCNNCFISNNFALTSGVVKIDSNGYFYFYDSVITQNYAKNSQMSLVFDSVNLSVLDKWDIYNNSMINMDQIAIEINSQWTNLWFLSQQLKNYINSNFDALKNEKSSLALIQSISGSVKFTNSTYVHDQDAIVHAFVSKITFESSVISSISMNDNTIEIVSSTLEFTEMNIHNISNPGNHEFIDISSESSMQMSNVLYKDSDSILFSLRSSEGVASNVKIENVQKAHNLFEIFDSSSVDISNFTAINSTSTADSLISIEKSRNLRVDSFNLDNIDNPLFIIKDSHFREMNKFNVSEWAIPFIVENTKIDILMDSSFTHNGNTDVFGGVLNILNSDITISNSTFRLNTAEIGGAIYFDWTSLELWNLRISNATFASNTASSKGGAIYYNFKRPQLIDVINQNNIAPYGPDLASYPVKIKFADRNDMVINDIGSNIKYEKEVKFALFDYDDQVMVLNNVNQITLTPVNLSISSIGGVNSVLMKHGIATFTNLIATAKYGSKDVKYQVSSKAINKVKINEVFGTSINDNIVTFNFRNCIPGESIINNYKCQECSAGSYSFQWNSPECYSCLDNAIWLGRDQMEVVPEYWRMTTNSTKIVECINKDACKGGFSPENEYPVNWSEGYKGILWSECIITNSKKYQKVNDFECQKCPNMAMNSIRVIGVCLLVFIFFMIIILINIRKTKESEISVLFRIMTNYFQLLTTSLSFSSSFPGTLSNIFNPIEKFGGASETFLSFDWFINDYEIKGPFPSNALFKLFLTVFLPIILTLFASLIWVLVHFVYKKWAPLLGRCIIISFISTVFILHPKLTEQSFSLFRCIEVDDGQNRVRIDTSIECLSSEHISWIFALSIPILIIWVVTWPLLAFFLLYRSLKKHQNSLASQYLLILYQGLKRDKFYWEFVNTLRKVLLLLILLIPDLMKVMISAVILYITIRIQLYLKPYKKEENNMIEILALTAGQVTLLSSVVFNSDESVGFINLFILIFIVSINVKFLLEWFYLIFLCASDRFTLFQIVSKLHLYNLTQFRWQCFSSSFWEKDQNPYWNLV
jgi:predicted outer membrane repeat protein